MWLFIDSARPDAFRIGLFGPDRVRIVERAGRSHRILLEVAKIAPPAKWKTLEGICVVAGPGSFTAVRTGVLVANLLSRLYRKPLIGVTVEEAAVASQLPALISRHSSVEYVAPVYSSEPNITVAKHTQIS